MLGTELTDLLIVHWFGWFFDLTIVFWLIYQPTRRWAMIPCIAFHLMNASLFRIGMFPWLCLAQLPLFCERDWPRKWLQRLYQRPAVRLTRVQSDDRSPKRKLTASLIAFYCAMQILLPYSHLLTPGFNTWTDGPYGYSWDMMVHSWNTVRVTARIRDNDSGRQFYLDTSKYTASDRWSKHADMTHQLSHCVAAGIQRRHAEAAPTNAPTKLNLSVFIDVWCSLNGRFQQRMFDPNVDMLLADWSPWKRATWIMPLLNDLTAYRSDIRNVGRRSIDHMADVLFVADFPGLAMDHFVSAELDAVTLTVIHGTIEHRFGSVGRDTSVAAGSTIPLQVGGYHTVRTVGEAPSTYMYTFSNRTLFTKNRISQIATESWAESAFNVMRMRYKNYNTFFVNMYACLLK